LGATYRRYGTDRLYIVVSVEPSNNTLVRIVPVTNPNHETERVPVDHLEPIKAGVDKSAFTVHKLEGDYAAFLKGIMKMIGCEPGGDNPEPQAKTVVAAGYPSPFRFATLLRRMVGKSDDEPDVPAVVTMSHGKKQVYFCNDTGLSKAAVYFIEG
jgi:hypothetical protein